MSRPDPPEVSWKAIEPGAQVVSSDGDSVGTVERVVGDASADIFSGLAISIHLLGAARFAPSERVRAIWPDRVELELTAEQVQNLPEHEEQRAVRWRPGGRGLLGRLFGRG
jgi:hypothetical protein